MTSKHTFHLREQHIITDAETFLAPYGEISRSIFDKSTDTLTSSMIRFIELSPFCCISSQSSSGESDVSPRGDAPGFVRVLNANTVLIPDRPGNWRFDTFRINGSASITKDPELLEGSAIKGRVPEFRYRCDNRGSIWALFKGIAPEPPVGAC